MKKIFYLILLLIPSLALTSCHDDDDIPNVDFNIALDENATEVNGDIYVLEGQNFSITGISVTNLDSNKGALITSASYYWNGYYLATNIQPNYGYTFNLENTPVGKYRLEIECPVYAADKSPATAVVFINVYIVASADDIPAGTPDASVNVHPHVSATSASK